METDNFNNCDGKQEVGSSDGGGNLDSMARKASQEACIGKGQDQRVRLIGSGQVK